MTPAVRATLLVIGALSIAIAANCVGIARGEEAQEFWRAEQGRASTTRQHFTGLPHRIAERHGRPRAERSAEIGPRAGRPRPSLVRVVGPASEFSRAIVMRQPAEATPAAFADRMLLLAPFDANVPTPLMQLREPLRRAPPDRPEPSARRRMLCLAGVLVAMLAAYVASQEISQRGKLWPTPA